MDRRINKDKQKEPTMKEESFCYWLQGFVELTGGVKPTKEQWDVIKNHLNLVKTENRTLIKALKGFTIIDDEINYNNWTKIKELLQNEFFKVTPETEKSNTKMKIDIDDLLNDMRKIPSDASDPFKPMYMPFNDQKFC